MPQMLHLLPVEAYTSQEWFDREQRDIFSKTWRYAGFMEDVSEPGQYISVQAGLNNIFIVILLLVPTGVMSSGLWGQGHASLVYLLEWVLLLASLPYITYFLLSVATPEAIELRDRRLILLLAFEFISLNTISFCVGYFNYAFMACEDFIIAGDTAPSNCWSKEN